MEGDSDLRFVLLDLDRLEENVTVLRESIVADADRAVLFASLKAARRHLTSLERRLMKFFQTTTPCSFCSDGRTPKPKTKLTTGTGKVICNDCIKLSVELIKKNQP